MFDSCKRLRTGRARWGQSSCSTQQLQGLQLGGQLVRGECVSDPIREVPAGQRPHRDVDRDGYPHAVVEPGAGLTHDSSRTNSMSTSISPVASMAGTNSSGSRWPTPAAANGSGFDPAHPVVEQRHLRLVMLTQGPILVTNTVVDTAARISVWNSDATDRHLSSPWHVMPGIQLPPWLTLVLATWIVAGPLLSGWLAARYTARRDDHRWERERRPASESGPSSLGLADPGRALVVAAEPRLQVRPVRVGWHRFPARAPLGGSPAPRSPDLVLGHVNSLGAVELGPASECATDHRSSVRHWPPVVDQSRVPPDRLGVGEGGDLVHDHAKPPRIILGGVRPSPRIRLISVTAADFCLLVVCGCDTSPVDLSAVCVPSLAWSVVLEMVDGPEYHAANLVVAAK